MQTTFDVGPQRAADGTTIIARAGNQGELIAGEMSGKHFEQCLRGRIVNFTIAGQALLLAATTGGHPTVINPMGSGVLFVPLLLTVSFVSGTTVIGSVVVADTLNISGIIGGAGTPIVTATLVAPVNAYRMGSGSPFGLLWLPTTNTFTAAPTVNEATSINLGAASPTAGGNTFKHTFDGATVYGPGSAMLVCYSVTTSTALFTTTIKGLVIPLPQTA